MKKSLSFNFHDVVQLKIFSDNRTVRDFYLNEYHAHQSENVLNSIPKIVLEMDKFILPVIKTKSLPAKHKCIAFWRYLVKFSKQDVRIDVTANMFGIFMVHHMIVHPIIRYLAANRNVLMLHAAAVTKNKRSIILTGKGGVGKTTTTSQLLSSDKDILPHADDYVFINNLGESLAYVTRSHLYIGLLRTVPEISDQLSLSERLRVNFFSIVRKLSFDRIKWPTRISQERLWPEKYIQMKSKVNAIVYIERQDIKGPVLILKKDRSQYINKIISMNFSEAEKFINLMERQYQYTGIEFNLDDWRRKEMRLMDDLLEQTSYYDLILPKNMNNDSPLIKEKVVDLLGGLLS